MTEETKGAAKSGPRGIVMTVVVSFFVGFAYLLSLTFSIQDPANLFSPESETGGGYAAAQVIWDAFAGRYGSGKRSIALMVVPLVGQFFCGLASITSNSRMLYAFSRDGAVPGSRWWHSINPKTQTPVAAVWCCAAVACLLGLPILDSAVVFTAVTSIATIGLYISYVIPSLLRITVARKTFQAGAFSLGALSVPIGLAAVLWVCFITVIFVLPTEFPVTKLNLNYAPVAVGVVLIFCTGWWWLPGKLGARTWFKGPQSQVLGGQDSAYLSNPAFQPSPEDGFLVSVGKAHAVVA
ncbi:amino-acid permease BAT1-like protein isoform X2 [Micractinium conductrix]|uniref:Amino-acid permease BAT1-like protein isoform X2 n=1 Tax=Micractinium conductrix TaxID=554055 RepID=A0A2P6V6L3_9CHLO|nr:amino-acid permease BAT1-like protein isoform X2 [Micractinium conductrix]|eukprot:PSC69729.1 amino-acid permease BAT1-like protein isoform X2 [Micractinium conductrix]